jgi:lysozyme
VIQRVELSGNSRSLNGDSETSAARGLPGASGNYRDGEDPVSRLREMLIRHEGLRLKPYRDPRGKLTIGVGRNLDDVGITRDEAGMLLDNDIAKVRREVEHAFIRFSRLDTVRKDVILNMVFNLGLARFRGFKRTIAAIKPEDWEKAAREMLNSRWAKQVGKRAQELAAMMRRGKCKTKRIR